MLHSLVFGEGVINDATSLVILRALDATGHSATTIDWGLLPAFARIFVASLLLGVGVRRTLQLICTHILTQTHAQMGMLSALVVRGAFVGKGAHSTDSEVLVTFLLAFLAYTVSESLELSGIFTVFFCGRCLWDHLSYVEPSPTGMSPTGMSPTGMSPTGKTSGVKPLLVLENLSPPSCSTTPKLPPPPRGEHESLHMAQPVSVC